MAVRSRLLASVPSLAQNAWTTLYTVPAERTAIVKFIGVSNVSGAARRVDLAVRNTAGRSRFAVVPAVPSPGDWLTPSMELALNPGDALDVWTDSAGNTLVGIVVAGALLEGAPG